MAVGLHWWHLAALDDVHRGLKGSRGVKAGGCRSVSVRVGMGVGEGGCDGVKILCLSPEQKRQRHRCQRTKIPQRKEGKFCSFLSFAP